MHSTKYTNNYGFVTLKKFGSLSIVVVGPFLSIPNPLSIFPPLSTPVTQRAGYNAFFPKTHRGNNEHPRQQV